MKLELTALEILAHYRFEGRNETAIREDWIRPLLTLLGYGPGTVNQIEYEESVKLREPIRMLGSTRFKLDYQPTVLGRLLWIIEAKAPDPSFDRREHLGQAWSYATHPEINVPLMVIADGSRIAVYDVTRVDWDRPLIDVLVKDLVASFSKLEQILGARQVVGFIIQNQIDRLSEAMKSELDLSVLDQVVDRIRKAAEEARVFVLKNQQKIALDQAQIDSIVLERIQRESGLWGVAQSHNGPLGISPNDVDQAVGILLGLPPSAREKEFRALLSACRIPSPEGPIRAWWPVRILRLAVCLNVFNEPGCDWARMVAEESLREHFLAFPDDPVAAEAHVLERVLPTLVHRLLIDSGPIDFNQKIAHWRETVDMEVQLRQPISAGVLALRQFEQACRRIWNSAEWTAEGLKEISIAAHRIVDTIPDSPSSVLALAGQSDSDALQWDPLVAYTIIFVEASNAHQLVPQEAWAIIESFAEAPGAVGSAAQRLSNLRKQ